MNEEFKSNNPPGEPIAPQNTSNIAPGDKSKSPGIMNPGNPLRETGKSDWKMPEPVFRVSKGYCPLKSAGSESNHPPAQKHGLSAPGAFPAAASEENLPDITLHNVSFADIKAAATEKEKKPPAEKKSAPVAEKTSTEIIKPVSAEVRNQPVSGSVNKTQTKAAYIILGVLGILGVLFITAAVIAVAYFWFFFRNVVE
jgi:hypothetical protein